MKIVPLPGKTNPLKVLVVNVFFDDLRRETKSPYKIPQATAPLHLAGLFDRRLCDTRIYNEHVSGPFTDRALMAWPDLLVLTGLNMAFDRMLHVAAYVKTSNPEVITVAGGHAVRAMPNRAAKYFDYVLEDDVEGLSPLVQSLFGSDVLAEDPIPRYDLQAANHWMGFVESSRNCNFSCDFCTLSGERNRHFDLDLETLRRQILAQSPRKHLCFLDNNFYSTGKASFERRAALLRELRAQGHLEHWSAMVTSDFFLDDSNLEIAREAGCVALFSGVETLDPAVLLRVGKKQNTVLPQRELIRRCMEAGIVFFYGIIFDVATRHVAEMRRELDVILDAPDVPLPSFVSLTIPLVGTPYFQQCLEAGRLLPDMRLRDLDGFTLTQQPLDDLDEALDFVEMLPTLRGYRSRVARKSVGLVGRHLRDMQPFQWALLASSGLLLTAPTLMNAPIGRRRHAVPRTRIATTEPLDPHYRPLFRVDAAYAHHFEPTFVTDAAGGLAEDLQSDYDRDGRRLARREVSAVRAR